jgi:hypothetical protein
MFANNTIQPTNPKSTSVSSVESNRTLHYHDFELVDYSKGIEIPIDEQHIKKRFVSQNYQDAVR